MASIRKRGDTYTITAYMGYDEQGRQRKKTTTYRPPDGVTPGKAEKLAKQYAAVWEEKIQGYVALDENRTLSELHHSCAVRLETKNPTELQRGNGTSCSARHWPGKAEKHYPAHAGQALFELAERRKSGNPLPHPGQGAV